MVHIAVLDDSLIRERESVRTWQEPWYGPPVEDHWTFPEKTGQTVRLLTYTNCEAVGLVLNGRPLGEKKLSEFSDRAIRRAGPRSAMRKMPGPGAVRTETGQNPTFRSICRPCSMLD